MLKAIRQPSPELASAFAAEERNGLLMLLRVRSIALLLIAIYLAIQFRSIPVLWAEAEMLVFLALGLAQYRLALSPRAARWHKYLFTALDGMFLSFVLLFPNPLIPEIWPAPVFLRAESVMWFVILISLAALSYTPWLVIWSAIVASGSYFIGVLWILNQPGSFFNTAATNLTSTLTIAERIDIVFDPFFVDIQTRIQSTVVLLIVAGILAVSVFRSRRLVAKQAAAARERANLARYFSPNMVDELSQTDQPLGAGRTQKAAVLFADIVGFTAMCQDLAPPQILQLLREYHGRMQQAVFAHQGTLDKYIGDAAMATFGTPATGPDDATRALKCAHAMVAAVAEWNEDRVAKGEPPVDIAIGIHYGPVVLGDIGGAGRLEFAVLGDTVNVASRLEAMTREVGARILTSGDLVAEVEMENGGELPDFAGLVEGPSHAVRGRERLVELWLLPKDETQTAAFEVPTNRV